MGLALCAVVGIALLGAGAVILLRTSKGWRVG